MGISTLWAATDAGPFSSVIDNNSASNPRSVHERVGGAAALAQQAGKVVRGFRYRGQLDAPPLTQAVFSMLRGIEPSEILLTYPGKAELDSASANPGANRYGFDWSMYETALPIGYLPADTNWHQIDAPNYGGPRTASPVQLQVNPAGGGRIFRVSPVTLDLLVSERPVIEASINRSTINQTEVAVVTARVGYGGLGAPIEGLALTLSAAVGTEVSGYNGFVYGNKITGITDASGTVRFFVRGKSGSVQQSLLLDIEGDSVNNPLNITVGRQAASVRTVVTPTNFIRSTFQPALPYQIPVTVIARPADPRPGQCVTYPEIPDIPGTPSRTEVRDDLGWNAGANSIESAVGDFELNFNEVPPGNIGAVIGFVRSRDLPVYDHTRVTHGFYFTVTPGGQSIFYVIESGQTMAGPFPVVDAATYRVQRVNGSVFFYRNGAVIHNSNRSSDGEVVIGASLYATRDSLPSTTPSGDCFWTQLAFSYQECGGGSSGLMPVTVFSGSANNGVVDLQRVVCDDDFNCRPMRIDDGRFGIYRDGAQWKFLAGIGSYFPINPTDYASVTTTIYRARRVNKWSNIPDEWDVNQWEQWAEYVGQIDLTSSAILPSTNVRVPVRVTGNVSGLPSIDPEYIYFLASDLSVYSQSGDLITTESISGAIYDNASETAAIAPIKMVIEVAPADNPAYSVDCCGMGSVAQGEDDSDDLLFYSEGTWIGEMSEFRCDDHAASIDGQPQTIIRAVCS